MKKFINESDKVLEAYKRGTEIGHCEYIDYLENELTKSREKIERLIPNVKKGGMDAKVND